MTRISLRCSRVIALVAGLIWTITAVGQHTVPGVADVVPPPAGSGPILVLLTGADGAPNHREQALAFAREGWLVQVVDSNNLMGKVQVVARNQLIAIDPADALRELLTNVLALPQSSVKRAVLVGYSLGGWIVLAYGSRMPNLVASAVAYYPSTSRMGEAKSFLATPPLSVPTLMFAGVKDRYMDCCTIDRARALANAAAMPDVNASLTLVEYPEANHGFVLPAYPQVYRPSDEADAFRRAVEHLRAGQIFR